MTASSPGWAACRRDAGHRDDRCSGHRLQRDLLPAHRRRPADPGCHHPAGEAFPGTARTDCFPAAGCPDGASPGTSRTGCYLAAADHQGRAADRAGPGPDDPRRDARSPDQGGCPDAEQEPTGSEPADGSGAPGPAPERPRPPGRAEPASEPVVPVPALPRGQPDEPTDAGPGWDRPAGPEPECRRPVPEWAVPAQEPG
jgi:hypothetical protein